MHTSHSWDAAAAPALVCAAAVRAGLTGVALTDHLDSAEIDGLEVRRPSGRIDLPGYLRDVEQVRALFPGLGVLSGVEVGEPHLIGAELAALRRRYPLDVVLGSVHAVVVRGALVPIESLLDDHGLDGTMERYLDEVLTMLHAAPPIDVVTHVAYPLRYAGRCDYDPRRHEKLYREIIARAGRLGVALELNLRGPSITTELLEWCAQDPGIAVTLGGDAHTPDAVGSGLAPVAARLASLGFGPCSGHGGRICRHAACRAGSTSSRASATTR
ncbi:hypothetical protein C1I92_19025 [Jiangella anatolica]|uniref:Histidinol-phosphatase n=1 Tax=Jiangella anatolica TaxID=2670374 RepID=A0A2W2B9R4_9ACTN|nr:hypothetical protein C1I92_19025 [Jiangella anatolica]